MNALIARFDRPMILTNTNDMPDWLPELGAPLLNPMIASDRPEIMVRTALHLRAGGLLYVAPDGGYSASHIAVNCFNRTWRFSLGIPALARMIDIPSFTVLAVWEGTRIILRIVPIKAPDPGLASEDWHRAWIMEHWNAIAPVIMSSPENLRFLSGKFRREFGT